MGETFCREDGIWGGGEKSSGLLFIVEERIRGVYVWVGFGGG